MPVNKNINEQLRNWELQQKQEEQKQLRNKYEYMNDKYQQMKNNYTNNARKNDDAIYDNSSDLADKNGYMRYELNNTFKNKDDKRIND